MALDRCPDSLKVKFVIFLCYSLFIYILDCSVLHSPELTSELQRPAHPPWIPRPPCSALLDASIFPNCKIAVRQRYCPYQASLERWRCELAANWERDPGVRLYTFISVFMDSKLSFYQGKNQKPSQTLHTGPINKRGDAFQEAPKIAAAADPNWEACLP